MAKVYYIPNGPQNLKSLFPMIDFDEVSEYEIEVLDEDEAVVATTPKNKIGCCCHDDKLRIHFLNHLSTFDTINLTDVTQDYIPESEKFKKGLPSTFSNTQTGNERKIVSGVIRRAGVIKCYNAPDMRWIRGLYGSIKAFIEEDNPGELNKYIPVVIKDAELKEQKVNAYRYDTPLEIEYANTEIPLRN